jgi:hypothetical protein
MKKSKFRLKNATDRTKFGVELCGGANCSNKSDFVIASHKLIDFDFGLCDACWELYCYEPGDEQPKKKVSLKVVSKVEDNGDCLFCDGTGTRTIDNKIKGKLKTVCFMCSGKGKKP